MARDGRDWHVLQSTNLKNLDNFLTQLRETVT